MSQLKTKSDDLPIDAQKSGANAGESMALKWRILIAVIVLATLVAIVMKQAF